MTFPPEVWDGVLRRLQKQLAPVSYEMWLPQIAARYDGHSLELGCPTQFHCDRIRDYFLSTIGDCVAAEVGERVPLRVELRTKACADAALEATANTTESTDVDVASQTALPVALPGAASPSMLSSTDGTIEATVGGNPRRGAKPLANTRMRKRTRETVSLNSMLHSTLSRNLEPGVNSGGAPGGSSSAQAITAVPNLEPATETPNRSIASVHNITPHIMKRPSRPVGPTNPATTFRQATFPLTFDSFTVGSCNALAREASLAFANQASSAGQENNPAAQLGLNQLFIVSEPGLGKTHLARAVINTTSRAMGERARYTTAESFTSEFTQALRGNEMNKFKRRYRTQCDLLVVEDVQFLEGKAATQLEFFHTVQHVLDCGGRVLLTSDKYPQQLSHLDERIRARIASGFVAQLDSPDAELRSNIMRAKAAHGGIRLPEDCLSMLVEKVQGNVRELEGALIQLVTIASLFKRPIDTELTAESLRGRSPRVTALAKRATPEAIIEAVAGFFQTSADALASRSRRRDVLVPRQLSMYLCRRYTDASLADIGRLLNRDHPSVANAIRKIERQLLENVRLRYQVEALIRRLEELGHRPLHASD
jgi:chromosomal replication initiator protein